ncbi:MAG: hypothetical protein PHO00_00775 [bacterium]|nr:hypothetical protein [bacterium]
MKVRLYPKILLLAVFISSGLNARDIRLPEPDTSGGNKLMETLKNRKSDRSFSRKELPPRTISNLLWAAF